MDSPRKSYAEWFAARRSVLSRGGLGLEGTEPGRPDPAGFDKAELRILICRLSSYDDVAASITHRLLLSAVQSVPGVYADLAFFPPAKDAALMKKDGVPLWLATGSKRAPADFDVIAISLSVQQEALNLPAAMRGSGLQLDCAGRMAAALHPLILLGGHGAPSVPFIHGDAAGPGSGGLVDAVCLGDGVIWLREILRRWVAVRQAGCSKSVFLATLARELSGTYVPALYRHVFRDNHLVAIEPVEAGLPVPVEFRQDPMAAWLQDYDGAFIPFTEEETEETLPLAAGCVYRCRFCQTGWMRKEFSATARKDLLKAALRFKAAMVNSDLNLLASDACSLAGLGQILDDLRPLFPHVSVKSLSVASLVRRPEYFPLLRKLAKHEFTFGVEGISTRLRAYLGKPAAAADLIRIAGSLSGGGLRQMKLFFILTGQEEPRDLAELEHLLKALHVQVPSGRIIASFMPLFHAPFTPLQFAPIQYVTAEVVQGLIDTVRHAGGEFRWSAFPDEIALMNRLCRAGRRATPSLVDFSIRRGLRYDRSLDPVLIREWSLALPADPREQNAETVFPWGELQASSSQVTLWKSYEGARRELLGVTERKPLSPASPPRAPAATETVPGDRARLFFWTRIEPEQARHPDHVIVRGYFRDRFAQWKDGIAAYQGRPRLLRPPGTAGLAVASAEFKRGTEPPTKTSRMEPADFSGLQEDSLLFGLHWPSRKPAEQILKQLKARRVKFQTVRRGPSRWHVVERAFRGRTGLVALQESEGQIWLYGRRQPALLEPGLPEGGAVRVLLAAATAPCTVCQGSVWHVLKSAGPAPASPACFDCLARPGRS